MYLTKEKLYLNELLEEDENFEFKLPRKSCEYFLNILMEKGLNKFDAYDIENEINYTSLIFEIDGERVKSRIITLDFCNSSNLENYYNSTFLKEKIEFPLCLLTLTFPNINQYGNDTVCLYIRNQVLVNDNKNITFLSPKNYKVVSSSFVSFNVNIKIYDSQFIDKLNCFKSYNIALKSEIENSKDLNYNFVNVDLFADNFNEFNSVSPEEGRIIIPIKGNIKKLKSFCVKYNRDKLDNKTIEQSFEGFTFCNLSDEYIKEYAKKLKQEYEIIIPKGNTLGALDIDTSIDNSSLNEYYEFEKLIKERNIKNVQFVEDKRGDIARINRIIRGFNNCAIQRTQNDNLVELVCENKIPTKFTEYVPDKSRIDYLHKEYPILNNGQITAIDKIFQMQSNEQNILLIQGPPGTGKTELILSLIKEFTKNNLQALITSNVQVACNNISQRVKKDKEIILKRYSYYKDSNGFEDKEHLQNQQNYISNQVLGYFEYNNKSITNISEYNNAKQELEELKIKLNNLQQEYQEKISPFNDYYKLIQDNNDLKLQISNMLKTLKIKPATPYNDIQTELDFYSEKVAILSTQKNTVNANIEEYDTELSKLIHLSEQLRQKIEQDKKDIQKIKEELANQEEINLSFLKKEDSQSKRIKELELINEDILKSWIKEIKNISLSVGRATRLIESKNVIFDKCIDLINQKIIIRRLFLKDPYLSQQKQNIEVNTLERLQKNCIIEETDDLSEKVKYLLSYKNKNAFEKLFINLALWGQKSKERKKVKEATRCIINYADNYIEDGVFERSITKDIDKVINIDFVQEIISEYETNLHNIVEEHQEFINICENSQKIISSKQNCINEQKTEIQNNSIRIDKLKVLMLEMERKLEETNEDLKNIEEYLTLLKLSIEYDEKIKKFINEKNNKLKEFELYRSKYNTEVNELKNRINNGCISINNIENSVRLLTSDTQSKVEAEKLLFDYMSQLDNIKSAEDSKAKRLIAGRGEEFDDIFRLGNALYGGEIISMTTNQIAKLFRDNNDEDLIFDYVIVDEASKCSIEDLIISLPHAKKLVLIGDYMQLTPIPKEYYELTEEQQNVMPEELWREYNSSTFNNLLKKLISYNEQHNLTSFENNPMVAVLDTQYRMNKGIYNLIEPIYNIHKELSINDGKCLESNDLMCLNIPDACEMQKDGSNSYYNIDEATIINDVLSILSQNRDQYKNIKTIGVISGYADQIQLIYRKLINSNIKPITGFEIGTFDSFQGKEYDLVIVSLVRTNKLGFLSNVRRMNVALSRAKAHLIVVGNFDKLRDVALHTITPKTIDNEDKRELDFVKNHLIPQLRKKSKRFMSNEALLEDFKIFVRE